jgi:GTP-binding protein HflX
MSKKITEPTRSPKERALLVGVEIRGQANILNTEESLAELELLAKTAGLSIVGHSTQKLAKPYVQTYIGPGKIAEINALIVEIGANLLVFDNELSPRHLRELEEAFGSEVRILDRTALILDIFALHANTNEGALQVELAQYEYRLPRLTRYWTHLARQAGGGGGRTGSTGGVGLRGPGETQLEVDRRDIRKRISKLKEELEKVRKHRQQYRARRKRSRIPVIALVGYTNAGKSTLLNLLSGSDVYVADELFATLDPTTRRVELPGGNIVLITDTVGFIQKLPTPLVAAFRATLEEINEADLLLHVIDITHPQTRGQARAVLEALVDIEADKIPVLTVFNKIDKLPDGNLAKQALFDFPGAVAVSALHAVGIDELLKTINEFLFENYAEVLVKLPYHEGGLIALFHEIGEVDRVEHGENEVEIKGKIPGRVLAQFRPFQVRNKDVYDADQI